MSDRDRTIVSDYLPDTTLHPLNGQFVVYVGSVFREHVWMSPDEADALADRLKQCAALARMRVASLDREDEP